MSVSQRRFFDGFVSIPPMANQILFTTARRIPALTRNRHPLVLTF
jgi:hypothetical protein